MHLRNSLVDEIGELAGVSRGDVALCCAIIEDAELAREFEVERRSALEMLCFAMYRPVLRRLEPAPLPRELTNLLF